MEGNSRVISDEFKLLEMISENSLNFDDWTSLVSEIERFYPDDIEKITLIYDSFLSKFPLCHGYWRKFAAHKARLCTMDSVIDVFERALQSAAYSVGLWADYCSFCISVFDDPDDVRRLFQRGISFVRKDYLCHILWDKFIEFEFRQQQWSSLARVCIETLRFPTKKLHCYYDSFRELANLCKEELASNSAMEDLPEAIRDSDDVTSSCSYNEISVIINNLQSSSCSSQQFKALQKYMDIGERFYQGSCELDVKIHFYEKCIKRTYFDVKALDNVQLDNWHNYLDFVERQGDFDWAVKLYERCLIPCANYPEFWMRYVYFTEMKGGREIAVSALDRATQVYLRSSLVIHQFGSWFKEKIGDITGARAAFLQQTADTDFNFVENVIRKANMEKRLGNLEAASNTYEVAIETAAEKQSFEKLPNLYIHFARLKYKITGSVAAATDAIIRGIKCVPHSKALLEELIRFALLDEDARNLNLIDSIITEAIFPYPDVSKGLDIKDREDISILFLEFVDLCGTIDDVNKAWIRHIKMFPCSFRTTSSNELLAFNTAPSKFLMNGGLDKLAHQSGNHVSDHAVPFQIQHKEASLPENHNMASDQAFAEQLHTEASGTVESLPPSSTSEQPGDNLNPPFGDLLPNHPENFKIQDEQALLPETHAILSNKALTDQLLSEANSTDGTHADGDNGPQLPATHADLVHEYVNGTESKEASQEHHRTSVNREEHDSEAERDIQTLTLETVSLRLQSNESIDLILNKSNECEAPQNTHIPNESGSKVGCKTNKSFSRSSLKDLQVADSPSESVCNSPVARHHSPMAQQAQLQPRASPFNHGDHLERSNADRAPTSSQSESQRHRQEHKEDHTYPSRTEIGSQMVDNQGLSPQIMQVQQGIQPSNQYQAVAANAMAPHEWQTQYMQQQIFATTAFPVAYSPQPENSQNPQPTNVQYAHAMQAYNQMWHYYYYQQQLVLQQQQQQLQLQQMSHQQQQQLMQPEYLWQQQQQLQQQIQPQQELQRLNPQLMQQQQYHQQQLQQQQWESYQHFQLQQQQLLQMQQQHMQQLQSQLPQLHQHLQSLQQEEQQSTRQDLCQQRHLQQKVEQQPLHQQEQEQETASAD